jgi:Putative DNA-binding domain
MSESGTADLKVVAEMVEVAESVGLRALVTRGDGNWQLSHATVLVGADAASAERTWRYAHAVFVERQVSGPLVAALMRGETQELAGLEVQVPSMHPGGIFQRLEGRREWGHLVTHLPRTEWELRGTGNDTTQPWHSAVMIGQGPTFVSFEAAFSAFFLHSAPSNNASQRSLWRVIRFDTRGWFHRITIDADSLTAAVRGTDLAGASIELTTPTTHLARPVGATRKVKFRLPSGLANNTLLVLRHDDDWLDLRHFLSAVPTPSTDPSVVWVEPGADVEIMIAGGEGLHVEFKQEVPTQNSSKKTVLKTVAAFASGEGGTILFGVDDGAQTTGLNPEDLDRHQVALASMIRDSIGPEPSTTLRTVEREGKTLLLLEVAAGGRWFALNPHTTPEFYVRRTGTTMRARHSEIEDGFAHQAKHQTQPWWGGA